MSYQQAQTSTLLTNTCFATDQLQLEVCKYSNISPNRIENVRIIQLTNQISTFRCRDPCSATCCVQHEPLVLDAVQFSFTSFLVQKECWLHSRRAAPADTIADFVTASAPQRRPGVRIAYAAPECRNLQSSAALAGVASVCTRFVSVIRLSAQTYRDPPDFRIFDKWQITPNLTMKRRGRRLLFTVGAGYAPSGDRVTWCAVTSSDMQNGLTIIHLLWSWASLCVSEKNWKAKHSMQ